MREFLGIRRRTEARRTGGPRRGQRFETRRLKSPLTPVPVRPWSSVSAAEAELVPLAPAAIWAGRGSG